MNHLLPSVIRQVVHSHSAAVVHDLAALDRRKRGLDTADKIPQICQARNIRRAREPARGCGAMLPRDSSSVAAVKRLIERSSTSFSRPVKPQISTFH